MTLRVALNRTPREDKKECECGCKCCSSDNGNNEFNCSDNEEQDFNIKDMREIQEQKETSYCELKDIRKKINCIMRESANVPGLRNVSLIFCSQQIVTDSSNKKSIVVRNFDKIDLEKISAWLRNNGFYTDTEWKREPHGSVLGTILVYWD